MDLHDIDLTDLPEDDELAFLRIESQLRKQVDDFLRDETESGAYFFAYRNYLTRAIAAAEYLNISSLSFAWEVPSSNKELSDVYTSFTLAVDKIFMRVNISLSRKATSVALNDSTRRKIQHFVNQIKEIVDNLDVPEDRREVLLSKLNAFSVEVGRNRTRLEALGSLFVELCTYAGDGIDKLKPAREWLDSITKLITEAKRLDTSRPKIVPPKKPKEIEPPRVDTLDDDVPF